LRLDVENGDRRYTVQRLQADMSINYHMWLHYYTTHSAQMMHRHMLRYTESKVQPDSTL
jgi:hypothetical protein